MTRPHLLLMPVSTELEWVIRPQLEEWAEVAVFDAPGVGDEPPADICDSSAVAERGARKLDELGWSNCVVAGDEYGNAAAVKLAALRPGVVQGLALGHASLSFDPEAEPPPVNAEVRAAWSQIAAYDDRTFIRHLTQLTPYGDELADRMLARIPAGVGQAYSRANMADRGAWLEETLRELAKPLLLAEHDGCLVFTREGYAAAVEAFPDAMTVSCAEKPTVSTTFADALRTFSCEGVRSGSTSA
jgi:pimeloyl-ACP methyl ester carboxylesterase